MQKYIFYTAEGYTESPNRLDVDNYQVLGWEQGETLVEAKEALLAKNNWIVEAGFNPDEIIGNEIKGK